MIKVKVSENKKEETEKSFPKLMSSTKGYITYFTEYGKGFCLVKPNYAIDKIGEYDDGWDMNNFNDYNEPITIQNA